MNPNTHNKIRRSNRRQFLGQVAKGAALGISGTAMAGSAYAAQQPAKKTKTKTIRDYLEMVVMKREDVEWFLDPDKPNWARHDPELGYVLRNSVQKDGLDGAYTIGRYGKKYGERKVINFADRPCRINTYGDSFTMCHQVSDGETWQEYLAAHFGEPVRNFGVGGYGVYHAYRRMLRTEKTDAGTPYVILNIWGTDDHYRSIESWRYMRCYGWFKVSRHNHMFHANPWDHLGVDLQTGKIIERKNLCPTPQSMYNLCDKEYVIETFKDDPALNMYLARQGGWEVNIKLLQQLAEACGLTLDFRTPDKLRDSAEILHWACARRATMWILEKTAKFCEEKGKKLLILLSYSSTYVTEVCKGLPRTDQDFVDALKKTKLQYVDVLEKHAQDFKKFRLTPRKYIERYFIGHYNPLGNHFFAFAIKDDLVGWLKPKPPTYRSEGKTLRFEGYL